MLFRVIFFIWIIVFSLARGSFSDETIHMGFFNLKPHQYAQNNGGKPNGAFISYFENMAKTMGYSVKWVGPYPLPRLTQYLKTGHVIDGTVGFPKYPVFEEFLYYPFIPVFQGRPTFIVLKSNPLERIESIDDIAGYRIGLVKSSSGRYTPLIDNHRDRLLLEELGGDKWIEQNIEKLLLGRLDALFDRQQYSMPFVAAGLGYGNKIKVISSPEPPTPLYIVFSKKSAKGKILLEKFNDALSKSTINYDDLARTEIEKTSRLQPKP